MVNPIEKMRACLLADSAITDITTADRIWGGRRTPPETENYAPQQGGAICFALDGGVGNYGHTVISPRFMFKVYAADDVAAMALYRAVFDRIFHNGGECGCMNTNLESGPIDGVETQVPGDWPFVLFFMRASMKARE